jgi:UDP-N-acetyl-D-galactosamine dehydrogenase
MEKKIIAIIGLGYVGLPLAIEFGKYRKVIGFDINQKRVNELKNGTDHTQECSEIELVSAGYLAYTFDPSDLADAQIYIVSVPTPVDLSNRPDTRLLIKASGLVGKNLKKGDIVIFESTVYPGATEEVCIPILEEESGLKFNIDFFCGYSPERVNPGDKKHRLADIKKITSGSTPLIAEEIDKLYLSIIKAGTHKAASIKIAEAAKVIENTQRDINIALMNEFSLIFHELGIDTFAVLEAANTKWNFLPFRPGLVGGHCIGVDSYYLTHKAQEVGYYPEVILAGRRINESMARYVADQTVKLLLSKNLFKKSCKILILGITFKENCPDIRNSKAIDLVKALLVYGANVDVFDPWINTSEIGKEYSINCLEKLPHEADYAAIIIAVGHKFFINHGFENIKKLGKMNAVIFDVKSIFPNELVDRRL